MVGIDFRNQQRNVRLHAMVAGVAHHDVAGGRKRLFDVAGYRGVKSRKDKVWGATRRDPVDPHIRHDIRAWSWKTPAAASAYRLPSERWLAATQVSVNQGCAANWTMNSCPTAPVAPRTPTSICFVIFALLPGDV